MAGFLASSESSPSLEQMEFCGNFLSEWNFSGILFGGLFARIAEYLLNGSPREGKFHKWRLLLEEHRSKIVYVKGIHNTVADTISWLEYDPSVN
jgi:hypothetical protein